MSQNAATSEDISNGKHDTSLKERAAKTFEEGMESVQETANVAQEHVTQATELAGEELRKLTETGTKFVRENPGAAVAGAVGIGILLGLALRGRD